MGMEALESAAVDTLAKNVLPRLVAEVEKLRKLRPNARQVSAELRALIRETSDLLQIVAPSEDINGSSQVEDAEVTAGASELGDDSGTVSDDEAMAMLGAATDNAIVSGDELEREVGEEFKGEEISADKAKALLAGLDDESSEELAAKEDGEMSDEDARRMLQEMDAPPAEESANAGEMSDEEAQKLLSAMDAPVTEPAVTDEMSDEEAAKLLAAMDAPAAPAAVPLAPPTRAAKLPQPSPQSADDEALAMLKAMGGMEEDASSDGPQDPMESHKVPAASGEHEGAHEGDGEVLEEIAEFSSNDFASDPDMMNDFTTNSDEIMETLDATILELEQKPDDKETIESIFRAAHTLKGAAGMFGFKAIERVMHRMENLFDKVRKGTLRPDSNIIDVVFQGLDVLRTLLGAVRNGKPSGVKTVPIVKSLELASRGQYVKGSGSAPKAQASAAPASEPALGGGGGGGGQGATAGDHGEGGGGAKKTEQSTIRVDLERLDALVNLVGELVIDRTRFASIEEELRSAHSSLPVTSNMTETVQLFGRHMNEIHEIIMKIRMVPVGNAFNKFTRIVRDLSRQLGKNIDLIIDGEDTELDKTLVEQIGDPLIHMIRNSCDHGIEPPEVRRSVGKETAGKIYLSARQEGNHIIISIQDDGKGLDEERIKKKAIEKGIISADQTVEKRDIFNLIFEPGFSTADKVTTVSGRGVGMDVVRKQISKLKGHVDLDSTFGQGTTTTIRLPLTLAIVQSLLVEADGELFAIPASSVIESVRIKPDEIQTVGEVEVIRRHGKVLPLLYLATTLDLDQKEHAAWYSGDGKGGEAQSHARGVKRKDRLYVVIVGNGDRRIGIVVDQLLHQQDMVIKSMGPIMRRVPCVAGGAVLGNGEVVLVLDIQELEDRFRNKNKPSKQLAA